MTRVPPAILRRLLKSEHTFKVIIVTSMWNKVGRREIAERRERELRTMYWKEMLDVGVNTERFDDQERTAHRILSRLLETSSNFAMGNPSNKIAYAGKFSAVV